MSLVPLQGDDLNIFIVSWAKIFVRQATNAILPFKIFALKTTRVK